MKRKYFFLLNDEQWHHFGWQRHSVGMRGGERNIVCVCVILCKRINREQRENSKTKGEESNEYIYTVYMATVTISMSSGSSTPRCTTTVEQQFMWCMWWSVKCEAIRHWTERQKLNPRISHQNLLQFPGGDKKNTCVPKTMTGNSDAFSCPHYSEHTTVTAMFLWRLETVTKDVLLLWNPQRGHLCHVMHL